MGKFIVVSALIWPAFEAFGGCDHWPAWSVYAAKPERVTVYVADNDVEKLPDFLLQYLRSEFGSDGWQAIRIDRWSLDALKVPLYPQDRFQVGVALGLVQRYQLSNVRIVVDGPSHWWTGERPVHEFIGIEQVQHLAESFWFNARPRQRP